MSTKQTPFWQGEQKSNMPEKVISSAIKAQKAEHNSNSALLIEKASRKWNIDKNKIVNGNRALEILSHLS